MICNWCKNEVQAGNQFCPYCGQPLNNQNNFNNQIETNGINIMNIPNQNTIQTNYIETQANRKSTQDQPPKKKLTKILAIIGIIIVILVALFIVIFSITSANSNKIVCKSNEGNITIMYNENEITGYIATKINYDLDAQKQYAKKIGIDAYIIEFDNWFSTNTSGYCTINGEKVSKENESEEDIKKENEKDENTSNTISANWKKYEVSINNQKIKLPTTYNELSNATGFNFKSTEIDLELKPNYYTFVNMYKNDKLMLYVDIYNNSNEIKKYTDCNITRISQTKYQVSTNNADIITFPGGLKAGDKITENELIALLGTPDDIREYSSDDYHTKTYKYLEDKNWSTTNNFIITIINGEIDEIQLDNR